jgi:hypothetical protein
MSKVPKRRGPLWEAKFYLLVTLSLMLGFVVAVLWHRVTS